MNYLKDFIDSASVKYNANQDHMSEVNQTIDYALTRLKQYANYTSFGKYSGKSSVDYNAFSCNGVTSRPIRPDLFMSDPNEFNAAFSALKHKIKSNLSSCGDADRENANKVIYTAVMSVACCFDLWQSGSRKTPGTFFEIFIAALLKAIIKNGEFSKHIPLECDGEKTSVSTDIVIKGGRGSAVIPLKITTRERIVQPFAQQRILDSFFGEGVYQSFIACISETQQDKNNSKVNHICVPGTIILYQKHLSSISGLYYCDIPERYLEDDLTSVISVKSMGDFIFDIYDFISN